MDPTIAVVLAQIAVQISAEHSLRTGRASDMALLDNRMITPGILNMIADAANPGNFAALQTGSHVPSVQPYVAPAYVSAPQPVVKTA